MAEIRWSEEALRWLQDIHEYIAADNPIAADTVIRQIYQKAQLLCEYPLIGSNYRKEPESTIRVLLYGHYRIVYLYRQNAPSAPIDILGIFHSALDMDKYLP